MASAPEQLEEDVLEVGLTAVERHDLVPGERLDERVGTTHASTEAVFRAVTALGGNKGWHSGEWLWRVRGLVDLAWGGPGLRRGRRHPSELRVGDYVDFWRVERLDAGSLVSLRAEMVLPGDAWLDFRIEREGSLTTMTQTARFRPRGLWGRAYWYAVAPFHRFVFAGLARGVIDDAQRDL